MENKLVRRVLAEGALAFARALSRAMSFAMSHIVAGAFASFGRSSRLAFPIRLSGCRRISIGSGVYIGSSSWLLTLGDSESPALVIGNGVRISGHCVISAAQRVVVDDNVLLARNVYISDHIHKYVRVGTPIHSQGVDKVEPVRIKHDAWLGQNVVVCPGVTIGAGAVIGANSVVTRDIPDYSVAVGAPARVVKTISEC